MLKLLDYSVEFPTTGRSFQNRIEFAPGLTAITGRNESGKTFVLEMIGYCLFGKAALRGLASDYRNLVATLNLEVGGKDVLIERAKKETLTVDGDVLAVGAEAINKEVPNLLGFGLDVFNIACAAQQGDLGALTEMKPTARRQMVDQLVGLDAVEAVEKDCKAEAKTQETVALSLAASLPVPQAPVKPDDYEPSEKLQALVTELQAYQNKRHSLSLVPEPVAPVEPTNPNLPPIGELEAHQYERQARLQDQARLQGQLAGMPEPQFSRDDLQRAVDYNQYKEVLARRGPKPVYSLDDLHEFQSIRDAQRLASEAVECPKCDHHFHPGLTELQEKLVDLSVPISDAEITAEFRRHQLWAEPLEEVAEFTIPNLQQEINAHAHADRRAEVAGQLRALEIPVDRSDDLRAARAYGQELAVYNERAGRYAGELAHWSDSQAALGAMPDKSDELAVLHRRLGEAQNYEAALGRYAHEQSRYDEVMGRAALSRELAGGYSRGADALRNARVRVKQELAPSLSKSASALITAMTNGERRYVIVDHDFNITVDGQPLQTLSGSGKSVVNLALRIGMGQVLTSKVLPIFMGDEIDKDMDSDRAASTHETFQNLREYLTQILIVTHKGIEADQVIQL